MASQLHSAWTGGNEGFVSTWYLDPVHIPTIGHGFTWENDLFRNWWMAKYGRKFRRGDTISLQDSLQLLGRVLDETTLPAVERVMPGQKSFVKEAASDTAFNAGNGSLKWKWAQAFAAGRTKEGAELLRVTAVTGRGSKKKLPGLVRRRAEAADLALTGRYPAWVQDRMSSPPGSRSGTHVGEVEVREAQLILGELGYEPGPVDGIAGARTVAAIKRFQKDHGTLKVDGVLGKATLTALQRVRDARRKAGTAAGAGAGTATGGAVVEGTVPSPDVPEVVPGATPAMDLGWVGDALMWGGLALFVLGLAWVAWRYRDELPNLIKRMA